METRPLGRTGISVSAVCLGTMTFGEQNSEAEGHEQMDYALDRGIDFIDTAEMYAVPPRAETYGRTEEIIGTWLKARGRRDRVVLATKVVGPGDSAYIRDGNPRLDRKNIAAAVEASLRRLRTDYIDLYQLHWPDRPIRAFQALGHEPHPSRTDCTPFEETLDALDEQVKAGKVRAVGLSNETPWGAMKFLGLAEAGRGPRMASIQNPYSLLNRSFEIRLAEVALREDCGLLAYAPLAAGALSGKYLNGAAPPGARFTLWPSNRRYRGEQADKAVAAYVGLARRHGLDPVHMALAFAVSRPFTTSAIIGATTMAQLKTNLEGATLRLGQDVLDGIEAIHKVHTYPCP